MSEKARLAACLSAAAGVDVTVRVVEALSGGAASMSYRVEAMRGGEPWPLVLQQSIGEGTSSRTMNRAVQAALQRRMSAAGLRVAPIVAVLTPQDGLGAGFVMEFINGETIAQRWLRKPEYKAAREVLPSELAGELAKLHRIPPAEVDDLDLPVLDGRGELQGLRETYDSLGGAIPVFEMAFKRLERTLPPLEHPALIHGDFRSGNFIVGTEGLRAILDWELAHVGDPLLDIGWLCTNTWRFGNWQLPVGGFGEREAFYKAYEDAGGQKIDRNAALAFEMLGSLRWGVMCMQMAAAHLSGDAASVERAAIGRRISETEADLVYIMEHGSV